MRESRDERKEESKRRSLSKNAGKSLHFRYIVLVVYMPVFSLLIFLPSAISFGSSPTLGKALFFKSYFQGKSTLSCYDCHHISERKFHEVPDGESTLKYRGHRFRGSVSTEGNECLKCHNSLRYSRAQRPGPPLENSAYRKGFKAGRFSTSSEAILDCMFRFQGRESTNDSKDLSAFLKAVSDPAQSRDYPYPPIPKVLPPRITGDSMHGEAVYRFSCLPCHQRVLVELKTPQSREQLYFKIRGVKDESRMIAWTEGFALEKNVPPGNKIEMPAISTARLSDSVVADLISYISEVLAFKRGE